MAMNFWRIDRADYSSDYADVFINAQLEDVFGLTFFFFQAEDGIRDLTVTGVQTCALPISPRASRGNACRPPPRGSHRSAARRFRERVERSGCQASGRGSPPSRGLTRPRAPRAAPASRARAPGSPRGSGRSPSAIPPGRTPRTRRGPAVPGRRRRGGGAGGWTGGGGGAARARGGGAGCGGRLGGG